jgi:hypothetical protein
MKVSSSKSLLPAAPRPVALPPELDPGPHIFIAPELRGHEHEMTVIRHDGDTDESHSGRCELVSLILEAAKKP